MTGVGFKHFALPIMDQRKLVFVIRGICYLCDSGDNNNDDDDGNNDDDPDDICPCVSSCTRMPDGDYQSCNGCNVYLTCSNETSYDDRPCLDGLVWDNNLKTCERESTTCGTDTCDTVITP